MVDRCRCCRLFPARRSTKFRDSSATRKLRESDDDSEGISNLLFRQVALEAVD
jgi:hypothetical protein